MAVGFGFIVVPSGVVVAGALVLEGVDGSEQPPASPTNNESIRIPEPRRLAASQLTVSSRRRRRTRGWVDDGPVIVRLAT